MNFCIEVVKTSVSSGAVLRKSRTQTPKSYRPLKAIFYQMEVWMHWVQKLCDSLVKVE
ncbi:unnamed protein product, partial [Cylindrotheca closterium]